MLSGIRSVLPRTCLVLIVAVVATLHPSSAPVVAQSSQTFPGGFIEDASGLAGRSRLAQLQIQAFLPPTRGTFTFPAPYNTQGIRLTDPSDCVGNTDCVNYVGYSYWRNINNHVGSDTMYIFLGLDKARGGAGPTLFGYNKVTDELTNLGPLFDSGSPFSGRTGEGWYFSATLPMKLYLNDGPKLLRYDVLTKTFETVFDISTQPALFGTNRYIWQLHSSDDDRVHIGTVRNKATDAMLGCFAYEEDMNRSSYFPKIGVLDECNLDKSGRWLVMLENVDGLNGEDNRIIDLRGEFPETLILDEDGAAGHADMGDGYMVHADNWNPLPNATILLKFPVASPTRPVGPVVHANPDWNTAKSNHVTHQNRISGVAPEQQYACGSNLDGVTTRENEIICYRLDGSNDELVVAPVMTDANAPGGGEPYSKYPKGNLDVTGRYFIWTSNMGGPRLDAFLVKIPAHLLASDTTAPIVSITAPSNGATVSGTVSVTASASDNVTVVGVQFKLDGANLGAEDTTAPYSFSWNTTLASNGSHSLTAVARDAVGNQTTSASVSVTVSNTVSSGPTYYVSPTGNDVNAGLSLGTPWKTLAKAAQVLKAGDTLVLRGGSYVSDYFAPVNSGTSASPITIKAYPGEIPIITGSPTFDLYLNIVGKSWFVIDGIHFENTTSSNFVVYLDGASRITVTNCVFKNQSGATFIYVRGNNNIIRSNTFDTTGNTGGGGEGDAIYVAGAYHLLENNYFTRAGHYAIDLINDGATYSHHNIIRGNTIEQHWSGGIGVLLGSHHNVLEDNRIYFIGEGINYPKVAIQVAGETNIIRRNVLAKTSVAPYADSGVAVYAYIYNGILQHARDKRGYHNVIYKAARSAIDLNQRDASINANNKFVNNILYFNRVAGDYEQWWPAGNYYLTFETYHANADNKWAAFPNGNQFLGNLILHANAGGEYPNEPRLIYYDQTNYADSLAGVQAKYPAAFKQNIAQNPLFVNAEGGGFHVQSGSPAIDAGVHLAKATGGGTSTTMVPVDDSFFFSYGFGIVSGDTVRVGGTAAVQVTKVDHVAKTLTLASAISFAAGDPVSLNYAGAAPDMGIYEQAPTSSRGVPF